MTAGPSGVNETLSERCFRPFASKTRELSGLARSGFPLRAAATELCNSSLEPQGPAVDLIRFSSQIQLANYWV